jgi:hypothetical protein
MTSASDRRHIIALFDEAVAAGARQSAACAELGLHERTLQRWRAPDGGIREDRRPSAARPVPANRLSGKERDRIVATRATAEFASRSALRSVPRTARSGDA